MTPKYWTGIAVCMLAIFAVGMLVARGVNKAHDFIESNIPAQLGLMMSGNFKVDGHRVGEVQRLQFMRGAPGRVDSAVLTVKVDGDDEALQAPTCRLRIVNAQPVGSQTRFLCTSDRDSVRLALVPFGHVDLLPSGKTVTLYVSGDRAEDVRLHAYRGTGSADSGDVDITITDGSFRMSVNGQEIVNAHDSAGGSLIIRDPKTGRPLVQISGDSDGGSVKVTDANGKTRVNIHGSSSKKDSAGGH